MANFCVKTKNEATIDKKPRVYFTCHPDDFEKHFSKICEDIFKTHDCAIYYTADMTEVIPEDERELDLGRQNLFVVPVTFKLLSRPNRAMDEDIPYALQNRIPVLPIMMEPELDTFYSKPDKFGELQYLKPGTPDLTEISYEEKLRKHLDSVLISDDLARRVREAFDAYIFLSYRKKDRIYANELMRLIHKNPECRDIAIWFDEFLTPGESFRENIETMLKNSKLFTLLVTPQLLEKVVDEHGVERDNYVVSTELPLARRKKETDGTEIFAVEMESTDRNALAAINITDYVNSEDEAFRSRLLETLYKDATTKDDSPEHNYLIGLAYLDGIDVEVDRERGLKLITDAAEAGLMEAMVMLYDMYAKLGDYNRENYWAQKIYDHCVEQFGERHPNTIEATRNLALSYRHLGKPKTAKPLMERVFEFSCVVYGEDATETILALEGLANISDDSGEFRKALKLSEVAYNLSCKKLTKKHPASIGALNNLAMHYLNCGNYQKAQKMLEEVYELSCRILGEDDEHILTVVNNLAIAYDSSGDFDQALETANRAYRQSCEALGKEHPNAILAKHNLAVTQGNIGNYDEAVKTDKEVRELSCKHLGKEHPIYIGAIRELAFYYSQLGEYKKSVELGEEACELSCKIWEKSHPHYIAALGNLAYSYSMLEKYPKAIELGEEAYNLSLKFLDKKDPTSIAILNNLSDSYRYVGKYLKAKKYSEKAYDLSGKFLGEEHPYYSHALLGLAYAHAHLGEYRKAYELFDKLYRLHLENPNVNYLNIGSARRLRDEAFLNYERSRKGKKKK